MNIENKDGHDFKITRPAQSLIRYLARGGRWDQIVLYAIPVGDITFLHDCAYVDVELSHFPGYAEVRATHYFRIKRKIV